MKYLAIDPSGNFEEGKGVTGFVHFDEALKIYTPRLVGANDFKSAMEYYDAVLDLLMDADQVVMEGYRLYNHKGMKAQTQSNSILETSQLIGIIRYECFQRDIPLHIQYAVQVKNRWSDDVLLADGKLIKRGNRFYLPNDTLITNHARDAYRHLVNYLKYGGR
jgi:hypothetical protein